MYLIICTRAASDDAGCDPLCKEETLPARSWFAAGQRPSRAPAGSLSAPSMIDSVSVDIHSCLVRTSTQPPKSQAMSNFDSPHNEDTAKSERRAQRADDGQPERPSAEPGHQATPSLALDWTLSIVSTITTTANNCCAVSLTFGGVVVEVAVAAK